MSLNAPDTKMSKSLHEGCVFLMEKPEDIMRKFKRAVTDSDTERCVRYAPAEKPGVSNLMQIYAAATGKTRRRRGRGGDFAAYPGGDGASAGGQGVSGKRVPGRSGKGVLCGGEDPP